MRRFAATHDPRQAPRFTVWYALGTLLFGGVVLLQLYVPGLPAELGHIPVMDWQHGILLRLGTLGLIFWALFGVRGMHALTTLALWMGALFGVLRIGDARMTHNAFGSAELLVFLALALVAVRVITRIPECPPEYVSHSDSEAK